MKLSAATALSGVDMNAVDAVIREQLHSDVVLIRQVAEYIIHSGGKRLRPILVMLSARALGYEGAEHYTLAAVIEFIHTATLLHDDVVDESSLRRGQQTANATFGNAASVLVGDFLYSRAFQLMVSCNNMRIMQILADATNTIAEGEVLQLMHIGQADIDEHTYLTIIQSKTAKLFEAAMQLGAIISNADQATEAALAHYGMALGMAFQIIDDVLDYTGSAQELGKEIGDDLAEGKLTLPLIYILAQGSQRDKAAIQQAIDHPERCDIRDIITIIQQSGALAYSHQVAERYIDRAKAALSPLSTSSYKTALYSLADLALHREQ